MSVIEALPRLGGYGVHTAKVRRAGVPFRCSTTIIRAEGKESVERAVIARIDERFNPIPGTEETLEVDAICLAVGLTPSIELACLAGCGQIYIPELGGNMPGHDEYMRSSMESVYVVGDIAGVEEASTAMEEGRLAGVHAAWAMGYMDEETMRASTDETMGRLRSLRQGVFGQKRFAAKQRIIERGAAR